jgi:hypothetical protein
VSRRYVACVAVLVLAAGCTTAALPTETPARNATLSLPEFERTDDATVVETRVFWDRSKSWEDPGNRSVNVTSRVRAYRDAGDTSVVVYTTPRKQYVGDDRVRALSAPALADLATRSVGVGPLGDGSGPTFDASLLGRNATVRTVVDADGTTTGHVARVTRDGVVVVVVVAGGADRRTVERVLDGVAL